MDVVYATSTQLVTVPGGRQARVPGGSHWPADDPVVKANPDLFSTDARYGLLFTEEPAGYDAPADAPVETATAAPGERRSTRRSA